MDACAGARLRAPDARGGSPLLLPLPGHHARLVATDQDGREELDATFGIVEEPFWRTCDSSGRRFRSDEIGNYLAAQQSTKATF